MRAPSPPVPPISLCPLFPRASVLDDSLRGVSSSAPVLSIPPLSQLPCCLPRSLSCSFVVSASKQQQTAASCMTALCRLPLGHMPLATCLTRLTCLTPAQRDVYHYYRDSRPALCQNPPRSRPRQLCVHLATPPCHRLTASCRPLGHCLRHTLASKLINLLQRRRHRLQSQFTFRSLLLIELKF